MADDALRLAIGLFMRSVALRQLIVLCLLQCATLTWAGEFSLARVTVVFSAPVPIQDAQFVRALSRAGGVTLSYVQPTAQDAHIYRVDGLAPQFPPQKILQRLRQRADVISAEDNSNGQPDNGQAQLTIKFSRAMALDPADPNFVWKLSEDVGITLRPISSNAHSVVFALKGLYDPSQLAVTAARLRLRPGVVSVQ